MSGAAARLGWRGWTLVLVMLALTALFAALGVWQLYRLAEKEALIRAVAAGMRSEPMELPAASAWPQLDCGNPPADASTCAPLELDYRPMTVTGTYLPEDTVLVFTSLAEPRGRYGGPGYWVMTPLELEAGGSIWVNRGFVPQASGADFAGGGPVATGQLTLTGIARQPERAGPFTPAADEPSRIEWVRNPERLAALARLADPVAPLYLDLPAGAPGELPQGGETVLEFPNNHLGYALTWFGFAVLTPILLAFWLRRQKSPAKP